MLFNAKMRSKSYHYFYQFPGFTTLIALLLSLAFLALWLAAGGSFGKVGDLYHLKKVGSSIGVLGYVLFSFSLFLSSRWKKLEDVIGGLDQIYNLHHRLGIWGFCLILAHPWILALKWLPHRLDRFFLFVFPFHQRLAVNLGSYAFWLMVLIIGITIFKLLPYDKWKGMHKFMSFVFILASLHFLLLQKRFSVSTLLFFIPMGLGLFGIIYKQIVRPFFLKYPKYKVVQTKKINDTVIMITLKPEDQFITFIPGQYAFFSFRGHVSREQHPFTIYPRNNESIAILAKIRGDFTHSLYHRILSGDKAYLEGPYGRFDFTQGSKKQIWIAGGIGIVPFLAWCSLLEKWRGEISLFYCIHRAKDALFIEDLEHIQSMKSGFRIHLFCSEKNQRLTIEQIQNLAGSLKDKDIFMCGPRKLTHCFSKELKKKGVCRKNIHFEDFEFI